MDAENVASTSLECLRNRVKEHGSVAEVAREVEMPREWLSRVISPKTIQKLKEVEGVIADE